LKPARIVSPYGVVDEYGREHRDHLIVEVTGGEEAPAKARRG
jgi:hypothetical protein